MKPHNKIFDDKSPLSKEEMQNYLDGKLNATDQKKVEEKFIDDDFASEAAEGYTESGVSFIANDELNTQWNARNNSIYKTYNYKNWFIGTMVVAVVAVSVIVYLTIQPKKIETKYITVEAPIDENNPENIPQLLEYIDRDQYGNTPFIQGNYWNSPQIMPHMYSRENPEQINNYSDAELKAEIKIIAESKPIEKKKQITYEKTIAAQPKTIAIVEPEIIITEPEIIDNKTINDIPVKENNNKVVESNVKMLYIKNLKAVDYSVFYTSNVAKKEWLMTGVSADKENASSEGAIIEHVVKYIPYKDFLNEYLSKFADNDFKGALAGLLIIQQQFPDDLNAAFYSGLCYFNLGKTRQAISSFDKAMSNSFTTFREESEWYKALSLLEDGQRGKGKELLKKIEKDNGFYAKSAREKLKGMK